MPDPRAPMTDSVNATHVVEGIISSYEEKLQSMSLIIDNTQMVLGEFQESMSHGKEEKEALHVRLRETLARNESLRKKDFDAMMNTILFSQDDRERAVRKLLHNYLTEQREMARRLKENLGTFKDGLNTDNIGRINDFHEVLTDILKKQEERKAELAATLKILQKEQGQLSRSLGELLSKGRELRIRDLKTMLKQFEAQSRERAAQQRERKEGVQKMLSTFRKKGGNQQTDTQGDP
jgi:bacterioferritin (cytochrome b1)